jgi:hypothetical protein
VRTNSLKAAIDYIADARTAAVKLHAALTMGFPRKLGPVSRLREEAAKDMLARDVRELFLLPFVGALQAGRLRGEASNICGTVLSANASVVLDALIARGCLEPNEALAHLLDGMLARAHPRGFFWEPSDEAKAAAVRPGRGEFPFVCVTAAYLRFLLWFGRTRQRRVQRAFAWLVEHQEEDGSWRPPVRQLRLDETLSYRATRAVAEAFSRLTPAAARKFAEPRRKLAVAWADRILEHCDDPDAVLTELNIAEDPRGPARHGNGPDLPTALRERILYFPLEDLQLALAIGAPPDHPHLAPWIRWLEDSQQPDGSWRLHDPSLRERLLLSDPNGRLRAESLYLTDEWITLRAAQILRLSRRGARARGLVRV